MSSQAIEITVSRLKAELLSIIDQIQASNNTVIITRHGKPVAELKPVMEGRPFPVAGKLLGSIVEESDIVTPLGSGIWNSAK